MCLQYISTGVPQGCVSSPVLFTLYTDGCVSKNNNNNLSDNTAILSLLYKDQDICLTLWNQSIYWVMWCLPPNCECEENWDDIRSEVNWWRLYIFIMFQSHRSPHINISVFILIALLHGMLTVCVLGYNKGCIFWEGSDFMVSVAILWWYCFIKLY